MSREDRVELAEDMRRKGKSLGQIAEALRLSKQTVRCYFADPHGDKLRERKRRYAGECIDCGRPTDGTAGKGRAPERCSNCRQLFERERAGWTPELIESLALEWHGKFGRSPRASEWRTRRRLGELVDDPLRFPLTATVQDVFGSWNLMLSSAGLPCLRPGSYPRESASGTSTTLTAANAVTVSSSSSPRGETP